MLQRVISRCQNIVKNGCKEGPSRPDEGTTESPWRPDEGTTEGPWRPDEGTTESPWRPDEGTTEHPAQTANKAGFPSRVRVGRGYI